VSRPDQSGKSGKFPGPLTRAGDGAFRLFTGLFGWLVPALAAAMAGVLAWNSRLAWENFGPAFLWGTDWNPVTESFGAFPFIWGTLVSSFLALAIAVPLGVGSAIFLSEMAPRRISDYATFLVELLAAIPSVILGLMGIFILVPAVRAVEPFLVSTLGFLPFFRGTPYGVGMLSAALVLALMILPYITSISRDVLLSVPTSLKEGALALGATRWEMVRMVSLPFSRVGIMGAVFLALGRALGETMAITMVIGNTARVSLSLIDPAYSMASVIANEFAEASSDLQAHTLIAIGLVLMLVTLLTNGAARFMLLRMGVKAVGKNG
jgi:phosphate transport system permease protein